MSSGNDYNWEMLGGEPQGSVSVQGAPADFEGALPSGPSGTVQPAGDGGVGTDINSIYQQFLGREVDPSGAATYAGWAPQDIINAIQSSQEYANRGYEGALPQGPSGMVQPAGGADVNALYQQYFGRNVDPSGLATWSGKSADEIIAGITGSQEYANRGGVPASGGVPQLDYGNMTPEQTVNDIYKKILGREADAGAAGWIEDVRSGNMSALDLAQRLQASDEGKAYYAAHPEEVYKATTQISQENAPFKKEGDQFGYYSPIRDGEGNVVGQQFNPTIDYSKLKYSGTYQTPIGGTDGTSTATTHQYEDNKGGTITVDDRGNMISYTPSTKWYAEQQAKHPDAIRQGYRNINYMSTGPLDQTINIMGQEVPIANQVEYMTNEKGQLVVDKNGNLIPMVYERSRDNFGDFMDQAIQTGIMIGATVVGGEMLAPVFGFGEAAAMGPTYAELGYTPGLAEGAAAMGPTYAELGYTPGALEAATTAAPAATATTTAPAVAGATAPAAAATAASSGTPAWLLAAEKGALVGGTMGGINALATGTNPLKGIGYGALTGAIGGGAGSAFGGGFGGSLAGGALAGGAGAALTGQNIGTGALYGAGSGALNYGLTQSPYVPEIAQNNPFIRGAISGAAFSQLAGRDPLRGAASGAIGAYYGNQLNDYVNQITGSPSTINVGRNQPVSPNYPEGSGYAGNGAYTQPPPVVTSQAPIDVEAIRGTQPYAPLSMTASYNPSDNLPLPDFEDTFPVTESEINQAGVYKPGDVIQSRYDPNSTLTVNDDLSVTVRTPEGTFDIPQEQAYDVLKSVESANKIDYSQGDVFIPEPYGGDYSKFAGNVQPIPSDYQGYEAPSMTNPLVNIGNQGAFAREPFMTNVADRQGSVTVEMVNPEIPANATPFQLNQAELEALDAREAAYNLGAAGPMSQPSDTQEALAISESPAVEANATPQEQEVISQLKDIITSPDTTPEEKQAAAEELKQLSAQIATQGGETGSEKGALAGVAGGEEGGTDKGVLGGVKGGQENGVVGGVIGGRGLQPGTGGGYEGEEPNPGEDKVDMASVDISEEEPTEEEPVEEEPVEEVPEEEAPVEEPPEEETPSKTTPRTPLPRQPLPIKKPMYASGIPGYSWNENITGALPHNLTATMLAGAPTQEGRRMIQQLRQLYPQLSTIDPHLLQTLAGRAGGGAGGGGGAGALPTPGYPAQASGGQNTTFAQSSMPASFNALTASGLQGLGGASNIAGYAQGGDVHIPEFKTGTTGHYVQGRGDGQSDEIPAMLANGEYVFDADTVAALGNGSNEAGAKALDKMREAIRKHKRSAPAHKIPPKAKSPLEYLKGK